MTLCIMFKFYIKNKHNLQRSEVLNAMQYQWTWNWYAYKVHINTKHLHIVTLIQVFIYFFEVKKFVNVEYIATRIL